MPSSTSCSSRSLGPIRASGSITRGSRQHDCRSWRFQDVYHSNTLEPSEFPPRSRPARLSVLRMKHCWGFGRLMTPSRPGMRAAKEGDRLVECRERGDVGYCRVRRRNTLFVYCQSCISRAGPFGRGEGMRGQPWATLYVLGGSAGGPQAIYIYSERGNQLFNALRSLRMVVCVVTMVGIGGASLLRTAEAGGSP